MTKSKVSKEKRTQYYKTQYKKRQAKLARLINMAGGECSIPGCNEHRHPCLVFHHLLEFASKKTLNLSLQSMNHSWKRLLKEFMLCVLVCRNHHRLIHEGWIDEQGNKLKGYDKPLVPVEDDSD